MQRRYRMTVLVMLLLGISLGYALLTSNLNILGVAGILNPTWDIHFENVVVKTGSVTAPTPTIDSNQTTVSYSVTLNTPGDFYEFTVDAVNAGTIDGMISSVTSTLNGSPITSSSLPTALSYSVTYKDGTEIANNQLLEAGDSENYKIIVKYRTDIDASDLPSTLQTLNFVFSVTYAQADDNAEEVQHKHTLYSVLEKEAATEGLAKEYTGIHHDSFTEEPSEKIYHWYATTSAEGTQILNKNNVIFANHCWQMIRTTDTGGVKMIYNGEADNNQCLDTRASHIGYDSNGSGYTLTSNYWYGTDYTYDSTLRKFTVSGRTEQEIWNQETGPGLIGKYTCRSTNINDSCSIMYLVESYNDDTKANLLLLNSGSNYSQFGHSKFYITDNSPSYVGYMYNTVHLSKTMRPPTYSETMLSSSSLATTYWYGHSVTWGTPTANRYNLNNSYKVSSTTDYPNLVGEYTFGRTSQTYVTTTVNYIAGINNTTYYYIQLGNETGSTHDLSFYNYTYTYGDSYTDNGNGTYTINNPTTINRSDWYNNYSSVGANKYVCKNAVNNICSDLWFTTKTTETTMTYKKIENNYKYASGFTYDNNSRTYTLNNDSYTFFEWDKTNYADFNNTHYTCWNESGVCSTLSYIYGSDSSSATILYYIDITDGKSVDDAIDEMFYEDNVNTVNSPIKSGVEAWYKHYLLKDYNNYIEDTIYCADRTIKESSISGWKPNGGSIIDDMYFRNSKDLSCPNDTDKFSVSNSKAKLPYKVGLMTYAETNLLNSNNARKTGVSYWLITPRYFSDGHGYNWYTDKTGFSTLGTLIGDYGIRPAISLIPDIYYLSGTGTMADPYIVNTSEN